MFSVWGKREERVVVVYDITYDAITGYPQFLIYDDGEWRRVSAKYYEPEGSSIEDLEEKYETDSRPSRWTKAWQDLREYIKKNGIDCDTEDVTYDFYTGSFKED